MTALKPAEIDAFIAKLPAAQPIVLVYGPDAGLVRERVDALIAKSVDDPQDPFALARLDDAALADEPSRLVEEAHTVPLFGGRRAVWVKAGTRNIVPAVDMLIATPPVDCRVIIEAGDLKRNAPLRAACERAKPVAALPCYVDGERDLARLVDDELRGAGLAIAADARTALMALLGGDRQASRSELRKLALYARGKERIELEDIAAVVADAAAIGVDDMIDAAFAGKPAELESQFVRARGGGTSVGTIMFAALRQVAQLHKARLAVDAGAAPSQALERMLPPLHFSRRGAFEAALRQFSSERLARVMSDLAQANFDTRRQPALADSVAQRVLLSIAVNARRRT